MLKLRFLLFRLKLILYSLSLSRNKSIRLKSIFFTYSDALNYSDGYDNPKIAETLRSNAHHMLNTPKAYVRDGIVFNCGKYSYALLGAIYAEDKKHDINVLDFGGNLGSLYYQHLEYLRRGINKWIVIEQSYLIEITKEFKFDDKLVYYPVLDYVKDYHFDLIILSSVLPYLEDPYDILNDLLAFHADFVFIDRTYFCDFKAWDFVMIQENLNTGINYPVWIFNKLKMIQYFELKGYHLVDESISSFYFTEYASSRTLIFKYASTKAV